MGWTSTFWFRPGGDAITSGLEVTWTTTPTKWSNDFFTHLFRVRLGTDEESCGAAMAPKNGAGDGTVPNAHGVKKIAPNMLTTDLSLRFDPAYEKISRRFLEHPINSRTHAGAWFKLMHRDMGRSPGTGPEVPKEDLVWQDPIPAVDHKLIDDKDAAALKTPSWRPA